MWHVMICITTSSLTRIHTASPVRVCTQLLSMVGLHQSIRLEIGLRDFDARLQMQIPSTNQLEENMQN